MPAIGGGASDGGEAKRKEIEAIKTLSIESVGEIAKVETASDAEVLAQRAENRKTLYAAEEGEIVKRYDAARALENEYNDLCKSLSTDRADAEEKAALKVAFARADALAKAAKQEASNPPSQLPSISIPGLSRKYKPAEGGVQSISRVRMRENMRTVDQDGNDASDTRNRLPTYSRNAVANREPQHTAAPEQASEAVETTKKMFSGINEQLSKLKETALEQLAEKGKSAVDDIQSTAIDTIKVTIDDALGGRLSEFVLEIGAVVHVLNMLPGSASAMLGTAGAVVSAAAVPIAAAAAAIASVGLVAVELKEIFTGTSNEVGSVTDTIATWEVGLLDSLGQLTGAFDFTGRMAVKAAEERLAASRVEAAARDQDAKKKKDLDTIDAKKNDELGRFDFGQRAKAVRANGDSVDDERGLSQDAQRHLGKAKRTLADGAASPEDQARAYKEAVYFTDQILESQTRIAKIIKEQGAEQEKSHEGTRKALEHELDARKKVLGQLDDAKDQARERFGKLDPIAQRQALDGVQKGRAGISLDANELEAVEKLGTKESKNIARAQYADRGRSNGFDQMFGQGFDQERRTAVRDTQNIEAQLHQTANVQVSLHYDNSKAVEAVMREVNRTMDQKGNLLCTCEEKQTSQVDRFRRRTLLWKAGIESEQCTSLKSAGSRATQSSNAMMPAELAELLEMAPPKLRHIAEEAAQAWKMVAFDLHGNERSKLLRDAIAKCKSAGDLKTAKELDAMADRHDAKVANLKKACLTAIKQACMSRE